MALAVVKSRPVHEVALGDFGNSLGFLLRLAQLTSFEEFFEELGEFGRPGEITVLLMIAENPGVRQGVLARTLMIKRAHMTKMVRAMEDSGLVRRTVPADDKRSVELWLTAKGKNRAKEMRDPVVEHEFRKIDTLTPKELAELKFLLRKYVGREDEERPE